MIHLKLYGLPRTYTNWVAYNVMKTFPEVRVWHNNCPSDPTGEKYWKHGVIIPVPSVDGYILVHKDLEEWRESMKRYLRIGTIGIDLRFLYHLHKGWEADAHKFVLLKRLMESGTDTKDRFSFNVYQSKDIRSEMERLLIEIQETYSLPQRPLHIESKRMWRSGDAYPLDHYLTEEDYETS